jgi:hypothetical protein
MPRLYTIVIAHLLDETWKEWFDGMNLTATEDGSTLLTGIIDDSTALHSVLNKIRNLNMDLVSVSFKEVPGDHDEVQ